MSRRGLLRSLGRCCLGLVALLVAGGAAGVLPFSLSCPLPLRRTHFPAVQDLQDLQITFSSLYSFRVFLVLARITESNVLVQLRFL